MAALQRREGVRRGLILVLALIPFAILVAREWPLRPDLDSSDYAQYVAHAEALVEGRPYADTGYIFHRYDWGFAPRAYPPGLPVVLAVAFFLFGVSVGVAKVVALLFSAAFFLVTGWYFARERGLWAGAGVALLLGLSPLVVAHSATPLSDIPFAAAVWIAILLVDRAGAWTLRRAGLVILAAGAAVAFRPHGLLLVAALGLWGVLNVRRRGWIVLLPGAVLTLAVLIGRFLVPAEALRNIPRLDVMLRFLTQTDRGYHYALFESHLYPFPNDLANDVFHIVTVTVMALGLLLYFRKRWRSGLACFGVIYVVGLAALPSANLRFAFPLYPLFVFGLLNGVHEIVRWLTGGWERRAVVGFAVLVAAFATLRSLRAERPPPQHESAGYVALLDHISERMAAGESLRLASFRPRVLALETGAPGMVLLRVRDPALDLRAWCSERITHVILGGHDADRRSRIARDAIRMRPEAFELEFSSPGFEMYRLDRELAACDVASARDASSGAAAGSSG